MGFCGRKLTQKNLIKNTSTQALNNTTTLRKKKWKEIIDAGTSTERKDFCLKKKFHLVFYTKPSAKPVLTLDSVTSDNLSTQRSP